jgi:hypothetical protein
MDFDIQDIWTAHFDRCSICSPIRLPIWSLTWIGDKWAVVFFITFVSLHCVEMAFYRKTRNSSATKTPSHKEKIRISKRFKKGKNLLIPNPDKPENILLDKAFANMM